MFCWVLLPSSSNLTQLARWLSHTSKIASFQIAKARPLLLQVSSASICCEFVQNRRFIIGCQRTAEHLASSERLVRHSLLESGKSLRLLNILDSFTDSFVLRCVVLHVRDRWVRLADTQSGLSRKTRSIVDEWLGSFYVRSKRALIQIKKLVGWASSEYKILAGSICNWTCGCWSSRNLRNLNSIIGTLMNVGRVWVA